MTANDIFTSDIFTKCLDFHGHLCPGLSLGYRATQTAMDKLDEQRSEDEEIVAIVETDACFSDAVQVMTGCTFGKGNFIYKDHGKLALTLLSRNTGKGVRVVMKPDALPSNPEHRELMQKISKGDASESEKIRFKELHQQNSHVVLESPVANLFLVKNIFMDLPDKAKIEPSEPCSKCGEATMRTKLEEIDGKRLCRECIDL